MKNLMTFLMLIMLILAINGSQSVASVDYSEIDTYSFDTHFMSDPTPLPLGVEGNPLDYCAKRIGIDARNFQLPNATEGSYRFSCRFPIIDYVSNDPLYMKQWTEDTTTKLGAEHRENQIKAIKMAIDILRSTEVPFKEFDIQIDIDPTQQFKDELSAAWFTEEYQQVLIDLYSQWYEAFKLTVLAKQDLTEEDLEFFSENPSYFIMPDGKRMPSITGNIDSHFIFVEHARRVKFEHIFQASKILADAVYDYVEATKDMKPADMIADMSKAENNLDITTPIGMITIYGTGDDTHSADASFSIDIGGDDLYTNNAGGCNSIHTGAALNIDLAGNDNYNAPDKNYVQGFGFLGVGYLVDLGGYDSYTANHCSQGAGILGVGAIWDRNGDDDYTANALCQGGALFGLGMLLDDAGEDFYDCATIGQGGATTLGLGIISDLRGDDRYHLNIGPGKDSIGSAGYGQGGGYSSRQYPWRGRLTNYGGVGILIEGDGNDRYRSGAWCDQGGSYIMSLGALVDENGNDHYNSNTGLGSGIHITNAILIDKNGHDIYKAGFRAGASGSDRSPGFLIDYNGNDVYQAGRGSFGTGCYPDAFSILVDYLGEDTYIAKNPDGPITMNNWDNFGGVWPYSAHYMWPYAMCMDLGGDDDYQVRNRANNSERQSFGHGIHLDMEYSGEDIFGEIENPLEPFSDILLPQSVRDSKYYKDIKLLQNPDTFTRFQAIGRIVNSDIDVIPVLVAAIENSDHSSFNRDVMDCIHHFLEAKELGDAEYKHLVNLLDCADLEVRTIMADNFGIFKIKGFDDELLEIGLSDEFHKVRYFAMYSLYILESEKAVPTARKLAFEDPSADVRRMSFQLLARYDKGDVFPLLLKALNEEKEPSVRVAAIEGMTYLQDKRAIEPMRKAAKEIDYYLQRAAGKGLAELYLVEGIDILIESLTFPSMDAFYNYDRNVPNSIVSYTGYEPGEKDRYKQDLWRTWFSENKDKIDLKANVDEFRAFNEINRKISTSTEDEQIVLLENFLKEYPKSSKAQATLAKTLNSIAWNMATASKDSKGYNPKKGLEYAIRLVEISPIANYVDTLVEAHIANGNYDEAKKICEEWIEKGEGVGMFNKHLERIKDLME